MGTYFDTIFNMFRFAHFATEEKAKGPQMGPPEARRRGTERPKFLVLYTLFFLQYTLYTVIYIVYSLHCTLYTELSLPLSQSSPMTSIQYIHSSIFYILPLHIVSPSSPILSPDFFLPPLSPLLPLPPTPSCPPHSSIITLYPFQIIAQFSVKLEDNNGRPFCPGIALGGLPFQYVDTTFAH